MKRLYVSIKILVGNLCLVMSYDVPCLGLDGWQVYPQGLLQYLKPWPVFVLHCVHIWCRERQECVNHLLCVDEVLLLERQPLWGCIWNASVSVFCNFVFMSAYLLQQLILLTQTRLTQMDLPPSPRKIQPSDGKYFSVFLLSSDKLRRIKLTRFVSNMQLFVSSNISALFNFLILDPHSVSFFLNELILPVQVRIFLYFPCILLLKSVQGLGDTSYRKSTLLHQVSSLSRSASSESLEKGKKVKLSLCLTN
jgi:hypothetical protein